MLRKITFGPPEGAPSDGSARLRLGPNDEVLEAEDLTLNTTPELDEAIEQAWKEHVATQKREAQQARRRARETEAARWEPMPIPPGASSLLANLYGNMRRLKQLPPAAEGTTTETATLDTGSASPATTPTPPASDPSGTPTAVRPSPKPPGSNAATPAASATGSKSPDTIDPSLLAGLDPLPQADRSSSRGSEVYASIGNIRTDAASTAQGAEAARPRPQRPRIIPVADDEELAGPAVAAARQLYDKLQSEIAEEDLLELTEITDELPQTPRKAVNTIENIIEHGALEKDFTGVAKERAGVSTGISPRTGRPNDHIKEMTNNLRGLTNAIERLQRSLEDTRIDASTRWLLESEIKRAEKFASAFEKALHGNGS